MQPKRARGIAAGISSFLNWLSENGLSLDVCGSAMRAGDAKICQQQRGGFGLHRCTAICVQCELAVWHSVLLQSPHRAMA